MGLTRPAIQWLPEKFWFRPLQRFVATLGRQHANMTWEQFSLLKLMATRVAGPAGTVPRLHREPKLSARRFVATLRAGWQIFVIQPADSW
jgi:hypothetical protein